MKVLLCHNFYQQAGGEDQVFADETDLLRTHGHEVLHFTRDNRAIEGASRLAVAAGTLWNRRTAAELRALVRKERPDVVHFHNTFPLISPAAYWAVRAESVPVVQTLHNYRWICPGALLLREGRVCEECVGRFLAWPAVLHRCYRDSRTASAAVTAMQSLHRAVRTLRKAVDCFIALADCAREKFIAGGLPAEKLVVKRNFVAPPPEAGENPQDCAVFVGRLSPEKGVDTLLQAWRTCKLPWRLRILGDGPLAPLVQQAATEDQRIEWLGRRPMPDVLRALREARCLIFPSVYYECCPKTLIESFACGTPVLASRLGAAAEMVSEGRTGLLFAPGNPRDLAARLEAWAAQPNNLWRQFRLAARAEYESSYTAERAYAELTAIYARVQPRIRGEITADVSPPSAERIGTLA